MTLCTCVLRSAVCAVWLWFGGLASACFACTCATSNPAVAGPLDTKERDLESLDGTATVSVPGRSMP